MKPWICALNPPSPQWTVGDRAAMLCQGEEPLAGVLSQPKFIFSKKEHKYALKINKVEQDLGTSVKMEVIPYKVGDFQDVEFVISDGFSEFKAEPLSWTVSSVLDPQQSQHQPYAYLAPFPLSWGLSIYLGIFLIALSVCAFLGGCIHYFYRKTVVKSQYELHKTALSPGNQFFKDVNYLSKKHPEVFFDKKKSDQVGHLREFVDDLEHIWRLYLLRKYKVSTLEIPSDKILKNLKWSPQKSYKKWKTQLERQIREMELSKKAQLTPKYCQQILGHMCELVEQIEGK